MLTLCVISSNFKRREYLYANKGILRALINPFSFDLDFSRKCNFVFSGSLVDAFADDKLVTEVFSKAMINNFVGYKYDEWSRYHTTTTDWEIKEYLKLF